MTHSRQLSWSMMKNICIAETKKRQQVLWWELSKRNKYVWALVSKTRREGRCFCLCACSYSFIGAWQPSQWKFKMISISWILINGTLKIISGTKTSSPLKGKLGKYVAMAIMSIRPRYGHDTATIRPLYGHYLATKWALCGYDTASAC